MSEALNAQQQQLQSQRYVRTSEAIRSFLQCFEPCFPRERHFIAAFCSTLELCYVLRIGRDEAVSSALKHLRDDNESESAELKQSISELTTVNQQLRSQLDQQQASTSQLQMTSEQVQSLQDEIESLKAQLASSRTEWSACQQQYQETIQEMRSQLELSESSRANDSQAANINAANMQGLLLELQMKLDQSVADLQVHQEQIKIKVSYFAETFVISVCKLKS
jgi:myosin heavy subunit